MSAFVEVSLASYCLLYKKALALLSVHLQLTFELNTDIMIADMYSI